MSSSTSRWPFATQAEWLLDFTLKWVRRGWVWVAVGMIGLVLGSQLHTPNQRVIQVIAACILALGALRVQSVVGLILLIPFLPFPKVTTYGSTNVAFVLLVFIIWLARVVLKLEKTAGRSPLDLPVLLLISAYLLSFSQIENPDFIFGALTKFFLALTFIAIAYLALHLIHDEGALRRVVTSILVMAALVQLTAVFELIFPNRSIVPGWIDLSVGDRLDYVMQGLEIKNLRVGGSFGDYELLAEFCAMMILLQSFVLLQAKTKVQRLFAAGLLLMSVFILLSTVTRGAIVSLAVAGAYVLWIVRRRIRFTTLVIVSAVVVASSALLLNFVTLHTKSGNIVERFAGTEFEGVVPDTRQNVWKQGWERVWESPVLGHGPHFEARRGVRQFFWPHNNYLFYWHITGIVGLLAFLFVLWRVWQATNRHATYLGHASYSGGLLLALRAMLLLFVVDQIKIDYIRNSIYPYWIWLFFGLTIAASRLAGAHAAATSPVPAGGAQPARPALQRVSGAPAVLPSALAGPPRP